MSCRIPKDLLRTLRTSLSVQLTSRIRSIRCVSLHGYRRVFALPAVLASEVRNTGKNNQPETTCFRFLDIPVPTTLSMGCSWAMFLCQDVTDHWLSREVLILLFSFFCRDCSTPPLFGSEHGMGSLGFRWSHADNFRVLARGENCTPHCRCEEGWSRCARLIPCQWKCRCSRLRSVPSQRVLQWNGQADTTYSFCRAENFYAPLHQRSGDGDR